jgi:hypothetical protein
MGRLIPAGTGLASYNVVEVKVEGQPVVEDLEAVTLPEAQPARSE